MVQCTSQFSRHLIITQKVQAACCRILRLMVVLFHSGVTTSPLESPHRSSLVSSPALRGGAGTGSTKLGSLDAGGPSPSMESLRLTQSIKSNYQVGVYETFKSVEQVRF
jgi:hypothetical protein